MATYKNRKASEPKYPVPGRKVYIGPEGGTFTKTPKGNKEYFGNKGR